jgi:hypothetical protein
MPKLPDFVTFIDLPKEYTIVNKEEGFGIKERPKLSFAKVEEAYDYIRNKLNGNPLFDTPLTLEKGDELLHGFLTLGSNRADNGSVRVLLGYSHKQEIKSMKRRYKAFLQTAKEYKKNPKDFYTAYTFLSEHPIFWHRTVENPNHWVTDNGLDSMWTFVTKTKTKKGKLKTVVLLEHGPYLDTEAEGKQYTNVIPCHDIRLDTVASSYEKAIIKLAARVHKSYKKDGTER